MDTHETLDPTDILQVAYVEADRVVTLDAAVTQSSVPSWGLARLSSTTTGATSYTYDSTAGQGVTVYIVDTGIYPTHTDFGGRAATGANYISGETAVDVSISDLALV